MSRLDKNHVHARKEGSTELSGTLRKERRRQRKMQGGVFRAWTCCDRDIDSGHKFLSLDQVGFGELGSIGRRKRRIWEERWDRFGQAMDRHLRAEETIDQLKYRGRESGC